MRVAEELRKDGFTTAEIAAMAAAAALELDEDGQPGTRPRRGADYGERAGLADSVIRRRLRDRIESSLYPEHRAHLDQVERAVVLVACGLGHVRLVLESGREESAATLVTILNLEDEVRDRVSYRRN